MSSASESTPSKGQSCTLDYHPAVYCHCGLKSPLCVGRGSGRSFYGCQNWLGAGCGFFMWKDSDSAERKAPLVGTLMKTNTDDMKALVSGIAEHICAVEEKLGCVVKVVEKEAQDNKRFRQMCGLVFIVVVCFLGILYMNVNKSRYMY
ncbi:unnamed protein product [Cuscuta epithymum]|nr:unnamed protein product [Cuscuta epithymum]CAH9129108.1 unnamed protein product [Cuscuta epithymum]